MLTYNFKYNLSADVEPARTSKVIMNKPILNQLNDVVGYSGNSIVRSLELFLEAVHDMDETILIPRRLMDLKIENPSDCRSMSSLMNLPDLYTLYTAVQNMKNQIQWGGKEEEDGHRNNGSQQQNIVLNHHNSSIVNTITPNNINSNNNNNNNNNNNSNSQNNVICAVSKSSHNNSSHSSSSSNASGGGSTTNTNPSVAAASSGHVRNPSTASMSSSSSNSSAASIVSESESEGSVENDSGIDGDTEKKVNSLETLEMQFCKNLNGLKENLKQLTEAANYVTKRYQQHNIW